MTALCSLLFADLPPFVMMPGPAGAGAVHEFRGPAPARLLAERIAAVKAMHKALYRDDLTLEQAQAAHRRAGGRSTPEAGAGRRR